VVLAPAGLLAVFVQVTTEEVLFRGYLMQQLAARFAHPAVWMILPSAVFGALHHDPSLGLASIWVIGSAMLFGIAACDLTARSGSLGPAIALHFVNNASAFLLISAQDALSGLALYRLAVDLTDPTQLRNVLLIDIGVILCGWLAARVALRR
jgi:membrane protease YdiL (CAAX protease family)